jgi:hypothetical protein
MDDLRCLVEWVYQGDRWVPRVCLAMDDPRCRDEWVCRADQWAAWVAAAGSAVGEDSGEPADSVDAAAGADDAAAVADATSISRDRTKADRDSSGPSSHPH